MEDISQICFQEVDGTIVFFNEAEAVCDLNEAEPDELELKSPKQPKHKGKKELDLSGLTVRRMDHYLSEEELEKEFGVNGWKQLPDAISKKYRFIPAKVEVEEHHIGVYASKTDEHMVKADHPKALLHGSLVSSSLGAAIINGKYLNAVPLYRLEQEFQCYGLQITRQNMAKIKSYLVQRVNTYAFQHPVELMQNIDRVTEHIRVKYCENQNLHFHHTADRKNYLMDEDGFWRLGNYVESETFDSCEDLDVVRSAGEAFGVHILVR